MAEHERTIHKKEESVDQKHRVRQQESQPSFDQFHAWEQGTVSITETPFQPPIGAHAELLARAPSDEHRANLVKHLQQTYGNRYVQRLLKSRVVQAKLTVSAPNDVYEQEADRVAKAVTRVANSQVQRQPEEEEEALQAKSLLQRQEEEEEEEEEALQTKPVNSIQCQEADEEEEELQMKVSQVLRQPEEEEIQTQPAGSQPATVPENLENRIKAARGGGHPLSDVVQKPMGRAFGADFSSVRVHTDAEADALNQQLNARAFTTGQDVFFRENEYSPGSDSGRELIAHELTHVVQQGTGRVGGGGSGMTVRPANDTFEHEADNLARHVVNRLRAPELRHVAQTPIYATPIRAARSGQIQRWAEGEHEAMGNKAWEIVDKAVKEELDRKAPSGPVLEALGKVSYGKITQFGGDYAQTVEELQKIKSTMTPTGWSDITMYFYYKSYTFRTNELKKATNYRRMVKIAETNVDHFSPLAQVQYIRYHNEALNKAMEAAHEAQKSGWDKGDVLLNEAIVTEGFAAHFLQDSYASGHQCPRALDMIPEGTPWYGKTITSLDTKSYHDTLCKVAVPILGPAAGLYHGDLSAGSGEVDKLALETANSLAEVLAVYWGIRVRRKPAPSNGPNMAAIEGNRELSRLWKKMTSGYEEQAGRVEKSKKQYVPLEMPGTKTAYTRAEIVKYHQYISGRITQEEYMKFLKGRPGGVPGRKRVPGRR